MLKPGTPTDFPFMSHLSCFISLSPLERSEGFSMAFSRTYIFPLLWPALLDPDRQIQPSCQPVQQSRTLPMCCPRSHKHSDEQGRWNPCPQGAHALVAGTHSKHLETQVNQVTSAPECDWEWGTRVGSGALQPRRSESGPLRPEWWEGAVPSGEQHSRQGQSPEMSQAERSRHVDVTPSPPLYQWLQLWTEYRKQLPEDTQK